MLSLKKDGSYKEGCCEAAEEIGKKVRAYADDMSHEARDMTATTVKYVRSNPVQSTLVAAGVGFILGTLLRR